MWTKNARFPLRLVTGAAPVYARKVA